MSEPYQQTPIHLGAPGEDISIKDLQIILQRFKKLHLMRLTRIQEFLQPRQRQFLELLPLIFHQNLPLLPGFVSSNTPAGIVDYRPDNLAIAAAKQFSKSFNMGRQPSEERDIDGVYLMGSVGSIAFSKTSDMDIWLCHRPGLPEAALADLQKKATAVEQWAATLDLEVHFFLMDGSKFRSGEDTPMSSESSGHTQHYLLLEEFYRTAIYIAGKSPVWWLVPPHQELNYSQYVNHLLTKRFIYPHEIIDFGGLEAVPAEEFTSATLWHLYKALHAPHKSLLKLLLLECYSSEYPSTQWLCQIIKEAVYQGTFANIDLDPYLLIYQKVEQYLQQNQSINRLNLARECFYLKIMGLSDSAMDALNRTYRERYMQSIAQRYHWPASILTSHLSKNWDISKATSEHAVIMQAHTHCYRVIMGFAREHGLPQQSNNDLKLIGRKLNAFLEKKPGKVEILTTRNEVHVIATELSIVASHLSHEQESWNLYLGQITMANAAGLEPLQKSSNLCGLLCWLIANGLCHRHQKFHLGAANLKMSSEELHLTLTQLSLYLSEHFNSDTPLSAYQTAKAPQHTLLLINLGLPDTENREDGGVVMSARSDAFSYGMSRQCFVQTTAVVSLNSWGEINTSQHEGLSGLFDVLTDIVNTYAKPIATSAVKVICQTPTRGKSIVLRIEHMFSTLIQLFSGNQAYRFLVAGGSGFYSFQNTDNIVSYKYLTDDDALLKELGRPQKHYRSSHFDATVLANTPIPLLYSFNIAKEIELFYFHHNTDVTVYIIDERGALYSQHHTNAQLERVLSHYADFLENILNRNFFEDYIPITYFQLHKNSAGLWACYPVNIKRPFGGKALNLRISGENTTKGIVYTVYCNEKEFSSLEHGPQVFYAAYQYILSFRQGKQVYPVHISDIELPLSAFRIENPDQLESIHFLNYKQKIEDKFNS
ncbi:MAG: class I adenylate cyclase [Methylococcales bacterium]|nr:class I adenylate cyclase [Methylococcaceae bacterium]